MARKKDRYGEDNFDFEKEFGGITFTDNEQETVDESFFDEDQIEQEEPYSRKGKKKKKKRKKKRYLLKFIILLLVIAGIIFFLRSDFFNIEKIYVVDNSHYTEEQIIEMAGIKTGDNLFEFTLGGLEKKLTSDPYISTAEIKRKLPNELDIKVSERIEQIVISYNEKFIVADYEGMVLRITDQAPELTVVNNLKPIDPKPGEALEVEETQILTDTLKMLKDVEEVDLYFKKISVSRHSVKAYVYDNLVVEGGYEFISKNLDRLLYVIKDLHKDKIKRGTIKPYGNGFSFQPEVGSKKTDN